MKFNFSRKPNITLIYLLIILIVFILYFFYRYGMWIEPLIDSYHSFYIPQALLNGSTLYSKHARYYYGPLIPYYYALLQFLFNKNILVYYFAGAINSLLFLYAYYILILKLLNKHYALILSLSAISIFIFPNVDYYNELSLIVSYNLASSYFATFLIFHTYFLITEKNKYRNIFSVLLLLTRPLISLPIIIISEVYQSKQSKENNSKPFYFLLLIPLSIYFYYIFKIGINEFLFDNFLFKPNFFSRSVYELTKANTISLILKSIGIAFLYLSIMLVSKSRITLGAVLMICFQFIILKNIETKNLTLFIPYLLILLFLYLLKEKKMNIKIGSLFFISFILLLRITTKTTVSSYLFYLGAIPVLCIAFSYFIILSKKNSAFILFSLLIIPLATAISYKTFTLPQKSQIFKLDIPEYNLKVTETRINLQFENLIHFLKNYQSKNKIKSLECLPDCASINYILNVPKAAEYVHYQDHLIDYYNEEKLTKNLLSNKPQIIILTTFRTNFQNSHINFGIDYGIHLVQRIRNEYKHYATFKPGLSDTPTYQGGFEVYLRK